MNIENGKESYRHWCSENEIPLFSTDWWLDAVAGENNWDVSLALQNGKIVGTMPYYLKKKYGFKLLTTPQLTQTMGVWINKSPDLGELKRRSFEEEVMNELIDGLPEFDYFVQGMHYSLKNWLPFYWRGFQSTTCYTYVIPNLNDMDRIWHQISSDKRRNIRKASSILEVRRGLSSQDFYHHHQSTLLHRGSKISYSFELLDRIIQATKARNSGDVFYAVDAKGNIHAASLIVWNSLSSYYLICSINPEFRDTGALSLIIYEAMKCLADKTRNFDFEGSMIKSVEYSNRQFGAIQTPYFCITKTNSALIRFQQLLVQRS
ncbi:methicillin resistance protein [Paenibacillus sp. KN14-4R]|uniref:methicillin resistance protein n=1 Tax=Paenibacillus sp. KN14-4R TaxID=3445773 RepID=UPI003FA114EB